MTAGGWVKLYRQESPAFRRLPLIARCVAAQLLKLTDSEGYIELGTESVAEMAAVLKRSMGGDRYDLKALKRHLPLLVEAGVYHVRDDGLQAGAWAGYKAPAPAPEQLDTGALEASYEVHVSPTGTSYKLHTGSIEAPCEPYVSSLEQRNVPKSLEAPVKKDRKKESNIQTGATVSGFKAREIFIDVFSRWRAHHQCEWAPGRKDYARIDEVSLKLIPVSRARSIPFEKVVRAALRGYTQTDAQEKRYSLPWFAKDASAYLTPRSFEPTPRQRVREERQEEEEAMTYSEAVAAGLIDPAKSSILKLIGEP